jgi:cytochrome c oxidase subunit IV
MNEPEEKKPIIEEEPIVPVSTYVLVFIALLILAGLTTGISYVDLGVFNTVLAMLIASGKMLLVVLFFMHLYYKRGLTRVVSFVGLFWLALLVAFSLADAFTRTWTPQGSPW